MDYDQNHTVGWYYGKLTKSGAKTVARDFIEKSFGIRLRPEDIEIVKYGEANECMFQLKNK